jgi:hypothetical protein
MWLVTILSLILCSTIFYLSYSRLNSNCDLYANMQEIQKSRVNDFWLLILKIQLNKWNKRTEFSFLPSKLKLDMKKSIYIYNWNSTYYWTLHQQSYFWRKMKTFIYYQRKKSIKQLVKKREKSHEHWVRWGQKAMHLRTTLHEKCLLNSTRY